MFAELVILLGLANIVLVYLIMRKLKEIAYPTTTKSKKRAEKEEDDEEEEDESKEDKKEAKEKNDVTEAKEKLARMAEEENETRSKSSKKNKSRLGGFFSKKEEKSKPHLSEMPDMNRVIEELQAEFAQRAAGAAMPISKKTGNEIKDRLDEIERM